jgi:hypothetical protein
LFAGNHWFSIGFKAIGGGLDPCLRRKIKIFKNQWFPLGKARVLINFKEIAEAPNTHYHCRFGRLLGPDSRHRALFSNGLTF